MNPTSIRLFLLSIIVIIIGCSSTEDNYIPANVTANNYQLSLTDQDRNNREVKLNVFVPDSNTSSLYPLLILSPGYGETYKSYDYLATGLSQFGWGVIVVNHYGSDADALDPSQEQTPDLDNFVVRPGDIKFAIDLVFSKDEALGGILEHIDTGRIAVAGHSLGSTTALQIAGASVILPEQGTVFFSDDRIKAVIAMSPQIGDYGPVVLDSYGLHPQSWETIYIPTLMLWGSKDKGYGALAEDPSLRFAAYDNVSSIEKHVVVIENAEHHAFTETVPWYPGGERDPRHHAWIINLIHDFLTSTLEGNFQNQDNLLHPANSDNFPWDMEVTSSLSDNVIETEPAIDIKTFTIEDKNRQSRFITADIYYPEVNQPSPVIIASHCAGCTKEGLKVIATSWAKNGIIVIVPDHIDSANEGGQSGNPSVGNVLSRAADVAFLSNNLEQIANQLSLPIESFDQNNIGLAGHYVGALTASVAAGATLVYSGAEQTINPDRIKAILLLSPQGPGQLLDEQSWLPLHQPMMVVTGSNDVSTRTGNPPEWRAQVFDLAPAPDKYLSWFEGLDASYGNVVTSIESAILESTLSKDISGVTKQFFNHYLLGEQDILEKTVQIDNPRFHIETK